ncbi:MAG: MdtA/MuxA family multidrug efflux RND transporter periplasmic adaptor subunit [Burkholderiaceae bacterium]|jgi:multidrug efflux system membrane fusion protein
MSSSLPPSATPVPVTAPARPQRRFWLGLALIIVLGTIAWFTWQHFHRRPDMAESASVPAGPGGRGGRSKTPPVVVKPAIIGTMDRRLTALGTVTARNTAVVRAQVSGRLDKILFQEGQTVQAGQALAQIDPRQFQVQLDTANAQLARDTAQLQAAEVDLTRYRTLLTQDSIARQQVDTQAALVGQLKGAAAADRAAIRQAQLQILYARVLAPIGGRAGLRQVDLGNVVGPSDVNGIVVINEVRPINVIFPLPQQQLAQVLQRFRAGEEIAVEAWDADNQKQIGRGRLVSTDNQVDVSTGTVRLKAEFANDDDQLFPNQFVNVRLTVETLRDVVLVPAAAVQPGAKGPMVAVVDAEQKVVLKPIRIGPGDGTQTAVLAGVQAGEQIITDGLDKIRAGMKVQVMAQHETPVGDDGRRGKGRGGERNGKPAGGPADRP